LLLGCLRERRGDRNGARDSRLAAHRVRGRDELVIEGWMASALAGQMTAQETRRMVELQLGRTAAGVSALRLLRLLVPDADVAAGAREMWLSPRGRSCANRFICKQITIVEFARTVPALFIWETVRQLGFGGQFTAEQDTVVWQLAQDAVEAYAQGRLKPDQI